MDEQLDGPYLGAAFFCRKAEPIPDGIANVTQIYQGVLVPKLGTDVALVLFVLIHPGACRGAATLSLRGISAGGESGEPFTTDTTFPEDGGPLVAAMNFTFRVESEQTLRFDLFCGDRWLTRIPLQVSVGLPPLRKMSTGPTRPRRGV